MTQQQPTTDATHRYSTVAAQAPAAAKALIGKRSRQRETLTLIASENHISETVLEVQSSELTNKYTEGIRRLCDRFPVYESSVHLDGEDD